MMRLSPAIKHMIALGATAEQVLAYVQEMEDLEAADRATPWGGQGVSRATYYRRRGNSQPEVVENDETVRISESHQSHGTQAIENKEKNGLQYDIYISNSDLENRAIASYSAIAAIAHEPIATKTKKRRVKIETSPEFDRFWLAYPRRIAKRGALKAFISACKRAKVEDILAGVERYARERASESPQYTKMPQTWLNQDCWLDDPGASVAMSKTTAASLRLIAELDADERERNGTSQRGICGPSGQHVNPQLSATSARPGNVPETVNYDPDWPPEADLEAIGPPDGWDFSFS